MPALTTITINDGKTTPEAHAFEPAKIDANDVAWFVETDGVAVRDNSLSVSLKKNGTVNRVRVALRMPVVVTETINGVDNDKVIREARASVDFIFAANSTVAERKDVRKLIANAILDDSFMDEVIVDGKYPYGG
jgi:Zn-dependent metalloprotease